jgi:glycosyltransferase involved in cell wall biosynthesis
MIMLQNKSLNLEDLPPPPPGKTGWPWTEQNQPLPEKMSNDLEWPYISLVTPSYNYGQFIEETIRSVLLQGYPNLEYIIIDGGSTDDTVEIIQKYQEYLTYWISEPDEGQTDAINKGYQYCTGDIFAWLNADDAYINSTCLKSVSEFYRQGYQLIVGECLNVDLNDNPVQIIQYFNGYSKPQDFNQYIKFWSFVPLPQPAVFIAREITNRAFPLDKTLYTIMDYQLFLRVLSHNPQSIWVKTTWVKFKYHGVNKTLKNRPEVYSEFYKIALLEAKKNYTLWRRIIFSTAAKDYLMLQSFIIKNPEPTFLSILNVLVYRPTLIRWSLFWKIFIKAMIGNNRYLVLKGLLIR